MKYQKAIDIIKVNQSTLYGAFSLITETFPDLDILNDFLSQGKDSCDQDGRKKRWKPFTLNQNEFTQVLNWWKQKYPETKVDSLGEINWTNWFVELNEK